jgi:hypothetical protein
VILNPLESAGYYIFISQFGAILKVEGTCKISGFSGGDYEEYCVDWIGVAQDRHIWRVLVHM